MHHANSILSENPMNNLKQAIDDLKNELENVSDPEIKKSLTLKIFKLRDELKLYEQLQELNSQPLNDLLPEIFQERRAIPNPFLRSALFGMIRKGKRQLVKDEQIMSMSQYDIFFSGEQLDQNDLEVWDTLMYLAKKSAIDNELTISLYELCKHLNYADQKKSRERILARAKRLSFGKITIKFKNKEYFGSLIDDVIIDKNSDGKISIKFNKRIASYFAENDHTFIESNIKRYLGDSQLNRWLFNFYESHTNPIPYKLEYLQELCRSCTELRDFKRKVKESLIEIKKAYLNVDPQSKWDFEIKNDNTVIVYKNGKWQDQVLF